MISGMENREALGEKYEPPLVYVAPFRDGW